MSPLLSAHSMKMSEEQPKKCMRIVKKKKKQPSKLVAVDDFTSLVMVDKNTANPEQIVTNLSPVKGVKV